MKLQIHVGGVALAGMSLYDLLAHARVEDLGQIVDELEEFAFRLRRRIRAYGRGRWPRGATETWPLAEAIRLRTQLEAMEHVLVVIHQRSDRLGSRVPSPEGADVADLRSARDSDTAAGRRATLDPRDL